MRSLNPLNKIRAYPGNMWKCLGKTKVNVLQLAVFASTSSYAGSGQKAYSQRLDRKQNTVRYKHLKYSKSKHNAHFKQGCSYFYVIGIYFIILKYLKGSFHFLFSHLHKETPKGYPLLLYVVEYLCIQYWCYMGHNHTPTDRIINSYLLVNNIMIIGLIILPTPTHSFISAQVSNPTEVNGTTHQVLFCLACFQS